MRFYEHNGSLYSSNAPIINEDFVEITQDDYELRLSKIRVKQSIVSTKDEWSVGIDDITEQDYINALEELGVVFDD